MKWDSIINLYKSSFKHNIDLLFILPLVLIPFFLMQQLMLRLQNTPEKSKVLHFVKAKLTTRNEPVANIIDDNIQLHVLSPIPDNFQGVK